jgi:hypothetical protein
MPEKTGSRSPAQRVGVDRAAWRGSGPNVAHDRATEFTAADPAAATIKEPNHETSNPSDADLTIGDGGPA